MSTLTVKELAAPTGYDLKIASGETLDLKSQGTVTMPTGSILQVVSATSTGNLSTTSTSYVASNLSATITPTSTSSKIYINMTGFMQQAAHQNHGYITIYRDSTDLGALGSGSGSGFGNWYSESGGYAELFCGASYLDSPSSTSAITYKIYVKASSSSSNIGFGNTGRYHSLTLMEVQG